MENYKKYVPARLEDINQTEEWRTLRKHNRVLILSNLDRGYLVDYGGVKGAIGELYPSPDEDGRKFLSLKENGICHSCVWARLIWEAFYGEIPKGLEVDHINSVPSDDRLMNLRLCTHKENMNNEFTKAKISNGIKKRLDEDEDCRQRLSDRTVFMNKYAKNRPVFQYDLEKNVTVWERMRDAERALGISHGCIWSCCNEKPSYYFLKDTMFSYKMLEEEELNKKLEEAKRHKKNKKVYQYDLKGNFVAEYTSIRVAERQTGVGSSNISGCITCKYAQAGGFIWSDSILGKEMLEQLIEKAELSIIYHNGNPVFQYDLNGNLVNVWRNAQEAEQETDTLASCICNCCNGVYEHSNGCIWSYFILDKKTLDEKIMSIKQQKKRAILQFDLQENFIREWDSIKEAGETLGIPRSNIVLCCQGKRKTAGGFIFKYKNEEGEE